MNRAAAGTDLQRKAYPSDPAALDDLWIDDPDERARRIRAMEHENARLYGLNVAFLAMWRAEVEGDEQPESASVLVELARICLARGHLDSRVGDAFVTIAGALGVSRERLRETYREALAETA